MSRVAQTRGGTEREIYDVVVIGGGGSGLAAAAAAAESGATVLLLEKQQRLGGTTRMAVGSISAADTRLQRAAGVRDDPQSFHEDMDAFTADLLPRDNPLLRAVLAREAGPTVDWLQQLGVAFAGPYPEPPHRVNRMHNAIPGPRLIVERLARTARRNGALLRTGIESRALLRDAADRVTGVAWVESGAERHAYARCGVILASGDFSGNDEMRQQHLPTGPARSLPINPDNRGDGFALVRPLRAGLRNMDAIFGPQLRFPRAPRRGLNEWLPTWPWLARLGASFFMHAPPWMLKPLVTSLMIANMSPSDRLFTEGAVLVATTGQRLDEERATESVALAPDRTAYLVMPAEVGRRFNGQPLYISTAPGIAYAFMADYERGRPDLVHRAPDAQALAGQLGMDAGALGAALGASAGGPLLALGPVHAMLTTTEGALATDAHGRVLDENGDVLEGLYAVGCMGQGGLLLRGHGLHLAWAFTSGRLAGQHAARGAPHPVGQMATDPKTLTIQETTA